ncbi:hypothetical protein BT63DRAFT_330734 [Microthyrium microscopicum]|uniref:Uncharacterized protein n=1 Tax=Microthyrium microscopicum TaxID=703497 RepID=A0A6A6U4E9_9PEZI|nr:hypothetical protein BT63DRAFT_330734 [Microthyrium microscopicum]
MASNEEYMLRDHLQHSLQDNKSTNSLYGKQNQSYQPLEATSPWKTGFWRRLPWAGILSLLTAFACTGVMVGIIVSSNESPVSNWVVQPSVYLAIASAGANIFLRASLSEGVAVAWWVKASRGAQLTELSNIWAFGTQSRAALLAGPALNIMAIAGIAASLMPINGPLLQRSSTVGTKLVNSTMKMRVPIAQEFAQGLTGIITGRVRIASFPTSNFSTVLTEYNAGTPVNVSNSGCHGTCKANLQGAGYQMLCISTTVPFAVAHLESNGSVTFNYTGFDIFSISFAYDEYSQTAPIKYNSVYKTTDACNGTLEVKNCTLRPATMVYPVLFRNDSAFLDPDFNHEFDRLIRYTTTAPQGATGPTTHGGMFLALTTQWSSSVHMSFGGAVGLEYSSQGSGAFSFIKSTNSSLTQKCPTTWSDPTDKVLDSARELAFRAALHSANLTNSTDIQEIMAQQSEVVTVFRSNYAFMSGAVAVTILAVVCVAPIFAGWWSLGRAVSLSPIEVGRAFGAPILRSQDANSTSQTLLGEIGHRRVQYGAVFSGLDGSETLKIDDPGVVRRPAAGATYGG